MVDKLYNIFLNHPEVCTDTRSITKGCMFFALKGPNFDANKFAAEALEKGAAIAVVDDEEVVQGDKYYLVDDVLTALQDLARFHRKQLTIPVIGLTGSNGKTTSKELVAAALGAKYNVFATKGNLNNHIGVALSVLTISDSHDIAVIEMGANHVGEIAFLCTISNPSHGFITNIGKAHLEGFGGIEGVIRGKSELYQHLINVKGTVWINSNSDILFNMSKRFSKPYFYPNKGDYYHCELIGANPNIVFKAENGDEITTQLIGTYNFENIATALCIAKYFDVPQEAANNAIAQFVPENNRSQVIKAETNTIILDAYNANPTSMAKAIESLGQMETDDKVAILGDMKELGEDAVEEHKTLGKLLKEHKIGKVYLCGELIEATKETFPEAHYCASREELTDLLDKENIQEATILIKASRSIGLEKILPVFKVH